MITLILALGLATSQAQSDEWADGPHLPHPVTNNAVAAEAAEAAGAAGAAGVAGVRRAGR